MKKLLSILLCFALLISSCIFVSAEETTYPYGVTPELIAREQELLNEIENNIDEIHAQIEEYQRNNNQNIQTRGGTYNGFQYLDGDIFITKSTSSWGLTGHAGILVGDKVLEITPGYNNGVPAVIALSTWFSRYPETIIMRYTEGRDIPVNAAWYGHTFYVDGDGADNEYSVVSGITSLTKDYCSSLVWKCYHFGAGFDFEIFDSELLIWRNPIIILPYEFITYANHNNFTAVNSVNW